MAFSTKAFGLFYKRLGPTGSNNATIDNRVDGYLPLSPSWEAHTVVGSPSSSANGWLNFPDDSLTNKYVTTNEPQSINLTYKAFPFGSHACDFLWNITVPSWSFADSSTLYYNNGYMMIPHITRSWSVNKESSQSFHKKYQTGGSSFGVTAYKVTSSWHIVEPKFINSGYMHYVISSASVDVPLQFIGSDYNVIATDSSSFVAYDISGRNTLTANSTSSIDGDYFHNAGGAGITRTAVSRSLTTGSTFTADDSSTGLSHLTKALKARRLYFPTEVTGSGLTTGTDYWFKKYTGQRSTDLFADNGGIYNVQLTLKKLTTQDYYPDTNTYLRAFIHNVDIQIPSASARIPGAPGWYPPDNNIVTIGNGYSSSPIMLFNDLQTGFRLEKFNFNLIQYGYPAQLCFEASGSLVDSAYFGIIIDDIQICKVGVTSDIRFIKPDQTTVTGRSSVIAAAQTLQLGGYPTIRGAKPNQPEYDGMG